MAKKENMVAAITIDEAIARLESFRYRLKNGSYCLAICIKDYPYMSVSDIELELDDDGALALLMTEENI